MHTEIISELLRVGTMQGYKYGAFISSFLKLRTKTVKFKNLRMCTSFF